MTPTAVGEEHGAGLSAGREPAEVILGTYRLVMAHVAPAAVESEAGLPRSSKRVGQAGSLSTFVGIDGRSPGWIVMVDELREEAADALLT